MEITVFAGEYGEAPALKKEHALGLFISTAEHNCMFDFGDKTAAGNLAALEIAPETADAAILSHGHLGAGGGLLALRPRLVGAKLYARESAFEAHYFKKSRWNYKTVSVPKKASREGFLFTKSFLKIDDELALLSNFKPDKRAATDTRYFADGDKYFVPDTFAHEQALLVTEGGASVLFVGGAHAGLRQMVERAEKTFSRPVSAVVGALELTDKKGKPLFSREWVRNFAFELGKFTKADFYFACGVGDAVFGVLQGELGGRVRRLNVGETKIL